MLSGSPDLARRLDEGSSNAAADCEESDLEHNRDRRIAVLCVDQAPFRTGTDGVFWFLRDGFVRQGNGRKRAWSATGVQAPFCSEGYGCRRLTSSFASRG